eukprot:7641205-Lingulodinium_polyedra.AAC.1
MGGAAAATRKAADNCNLGRRAVRKTATTGRNARWRSAAVWRPLLRHWGSRGNTAIALANAKTFATL